jgi:transposase
VLTLPSTVRIYVSTQPVDLRKSFDGLSIAVTSLLGHDPLSGHLYCFFNRRGNQVRVLFWDRTGWCIIAKRLARGTFRLASIARDDAACVEVDAAELWLILEGIDLHGARRRRRYRRLPPIAPVAAAG